MRIWRSAPFVLICIVVGNPTFRGQGVLLPRNSREAGMVGAGGSAMRLFDLNRDEKKPASRGHGQTGFHCCHAVLMPRYVPGMC